MILSYILMTLLTKFMQPGRNIYASFYLFNWLLNIVTTFQWQNNEVRCAVIKIQNVNTAGKYEQTFNLNWFNVDGCFYLFLKN